MIKCCQPKILKWLTIFFCGVIIHTVIKMKLKDLIMCSMSTCLIVVCAYISIPMAVPFTLQTLAIFLSMGVLGGKKSLISISLYILIGMLGLPVFSGFKSGLGVIMGPTGGYVIGFIFMPIIYMFFEKKKDLFKIIGMVLGLLACYTLGSIWFIIVYTKEITLFKVLMMCVIPFIIPDLVKMVIAFLASKKLYPIYNKVDE